MKKKEQEIIENYKAIEEVSDDFYLMTLSLFLQSKIEFLERKSSWLASNYKNRNVYQDQVTVLNRVLKKVNRNLEVINGTNRFLKIFGSNVRNYRLKLNLTLDDLAKKSYFNADELDSIENGEYFINDIYDLNHISLLVDCSLRETAGYNSTDKKINNERRVGN